MFVPFLPLERGHVRQCAERELLQRGKDPKDHQHVIDKAADQVLVQCLQKMCDQKMYANPVIRVIWFLGYGV